MNEKGKHVQCFDGNFLLAEAEVVMTTLLSSLYMKFLSLEKLWYFTSIYIINGFSQWWKWL